jgi:hypothetical protein
MGLQSALHYLPESSVKLPRIPPFFNVLVNRDTARFKHTPHAGQKQH